MKVQGPWAGRLHPGIIAEGAVALQFRERADLKVSSRLDVLSDGHAMAGDQTDIEGRACIEDGVRPNRRVLADPQARRHRLHLPRRSRAEFAVRSHPAARSDLDTTVNNGEGTELTICGDLGFGTDNGAGVYGHQELLGKLSMIKILRQWLGTRGSVDPPPAPIATSAEALPALATVDLTADKEPERLALDAAVQQLQARDIAGARALIQPFVEATSQAATLALAARVALVQGRFEEAASFLVRAEQLQPLEPNIWELQAETLLSLRRFAEELAYRRKLVYLVKTPDASALVAFVRATVHAARVGTKLSFGEVQVAVRKIDTAPGVTEELRLEFAEWLYCIAEFEAEARRHWAEVRPPRPEQQDVEAQWLTLRKWCQRSGMVLHEIRPDDPDKDFPSLLGELRDVMVFPNFQWIPIVDGGRVALDGLQMARMRTLREQPTTPLLMVNQIKVELRLPRQTERIDTPALLIGGTPQYYHHTIDFLSGLAVAETLGVGTDRALVVNDDLAPFQRELFDLLGYPEHRFIQVGSEPRLSFADLTVPSRLTRGGGWFSPLLVEWYRRRLVPAAGGSMAGGARKLYVSRAHAPRRRLVNEKAVSALMSQSGYEIVFPEQLSVREQIRLFSEAASVVAPTGAALTNLIYMPSGGQVTVLYSRYAGVGSAELYFDKLAERCGLGFQALLGESHSLEGLERVLDADFEADLEELRSAIDR